MVPKEFLLHQFPWLDDFLAQSVNSHLLPEGEVRDLLITSSDGVFSKIELEIEDEETGVGSPIRFLTQDGEPIADALWELGGGGVELEVEYYEGYNDQPTAIDSIAYVVMGVANSMYDHRQHFVIYWVIKA